MKTLDANEIQLVSGGGHMAAGSFIVLGCSSACIALGIGAAALLAVDYVFFDGNITALIT